MGQRHRQKRSETPAPQRHRGAMPCSLQVEPIRLSNPCPETVLPPQEVAADHGQRSGLRRFDRARRLEPQRRRRFAETHKQSLERRIDKWSSARQSASLSVGDRPVDTRHEQTFGGDIQVVEAFRHRPPVGGGTPLELFVRQAGHQAVAVLAD